MLFTKILILQATVCLNDCAFNDDGKRSGERGREREKKRKLRKADDA